MKKKTLIISLILVFFFPVGLPLMWKFSDWTKRTKWIITGVIAFILAISLVIAYYSVPNITVGDIKKDGRISTDNAKYELAGYISSMKSATLTINNEPVVLLESSNKFSYDVSLKEGDNTFDFIATNENGKMKKSYIIHRTTKAEFAARVAAKELAAKKKAEEEKAKEDVIANELSNQKAEADIQAKKKAEVEAGAKSIADAKAAAEAQKPLHTFDEFNKWTTTYIDYIDGSEYERWSRIDSKCGIYQDIDGDGDKDVYYDKSCLQDSYKEYIKPSGFDYGSSRDNTGQLCPASEQYYTYFCSRFWDLLAMIRSMSHPIAFSLVDKEAQQKVEAIYSEIARTKGGN